MAQYDPQQLVFVHEAGVDDQTNLCRYGWALLGQACVCHTSFLRGRKYSILPALSVDGIVALDIFEGSVNREHFLTFLRNHLVWHSFDISHHQLILWIRHHSWILFPWIIVWLLWTIAQFIMMRISTRLLKTNVVSIWYWTRILLTRLHRCKACLPPTLLTWPQSNWRDFFIHEGMAVMTWKGCNQSSGTTMAYSSRHVSGDSWRCWGLVWKLQLYVNFSHFGMEFVANWRGQ